MGITTKTNYTWNNLRVYSMLLPLTKRSVVGAILWLFMGSAVVAAPFDSILQIGQRQVQESQSSQKRIDKIAAETERKLLEYKQVLREVEGLKIYNERLQRQIDDQNRRIENLDRSISQVAVIQRQIVPLMVQMVDTLAQFVALDVPFHIEERKERVAFLHKNIDRSDLSNAEKFRQVLEAYRIESEYGRKIDSYTDVVEGRDVNVLRIGRIVLIAQTTDTERAWLWDNKGRQWTELNAAEYRNILLHALRMANDQDVIKLLRMPIPAPTDVDA